MGGFRGRVSVRGENIQFSEFKKHYTVKCPHKTRKPNVSVCVCVCVCVCVLVS